MIRFSCSACGKRMKVSDEYAGRQSKCPVCGAAIQVPPADAWDEDDLPPLPQSRTTTTVLAEVQPPTPLPKSSMVPAALTQIQTGEDEDDEPEGYRPPWRKLERAGSTELWWDDQKSDGSAGESAEAKKRPRWRDPVVVIGAIPILVLTAFTAYLYIDHSEKEFEGRVIGLKLQADDLARSKQPQLAIEKYDELLALVRGKRFGAGRYHIIVASSETSKDRLRSEMRAELEREEQRQRDRAEAERRAAEKRAKPKPEPPIHLTDVELATAAEMFIRLHIVAACESVDRTDEVTIQALETELAEPDGRKIPWLWYATANVAVSVKPQKPGMAAGHIAMVWKVLFQFTPDCNGGEFWREITMVQDGSRIRRHFDLSEWTPEFRAKVSGDWLKMFQDFNQRDNSLTESERRETLQSYKEGVSLNLKITMEELDEILASPGALPRLAATPKTEVKAASAPPPPPKPPTVEVRVFAECKEMWADANRRAKAMVHGHLGSSKAMEFLRGRKQEIINELAEKYGLSRQEVRAIVKP